MSQDDFVNPVSAWFDSPEPEPERPWWMKELYRYEQALMGGALEQGRLEADKDALKVERDFFHDEARAQQERAGTAEWALKRSEAEVERLRAEMLHAAKEIDEVLSATTDGSPPYIEAWLAGGCVACGKGAREWGYRCDACLKSGPSLLRSWTDACDAAAAKNGSER